MNSQKQLTLAWTVAAILAALLVISLVMQFSQPKDLGTVLQEGKEDVTAQRDRVAEACNGTDAASQADCKNELQELADILREFSRDITKATSSAETAQ